MKIISNNELIDLTEVSGGKFKVNNLSDAYLFCQKVASNHYENFPVGSLLVPSNLRKYFFSVYAYARIADDIADELRIDREERFILIDKYSDLLNIENIKHKTTGNPVFVAVHDTMNQLKIPTEPFKKLLMAFKRDILFKQAEDFEDLIDYCNYSANPIGELILYIYKLRNEKTLEYSNQVCTGLQLANFWQDLSIDLNNGRCFIPSKILEKYGLSKENLHDNEKSGNLLLCLNEIYNFTDKFFKNGRDLIKHLKYFRLKAEINTVINGGEKIMKEIRKMKTKIIHERPVLSKIDYIFLLMKSLLLK